MEKLLRLFSNNSRLFITSFLVFAFVLGMVGGASPAKVRADQPTITYNYTQPAERTGGEKVYFGQLHSHTNLSDGIGPVQEAYCYARDVAGLDFFAVTDHSCYFDQAPGKDMVGDILLKGGLDKYNANSNSWKAGIKAAEDAYREGEFISFYGYEMTWAGGPGHINTFATGGFVSQRNSALNVKTNDMGLRGYYELLKAAPKSISMFSHPGTTYGDFNNFAYYDPVIGQRITLIEVANGDGEVDSDAYFRTFWLYKNALDRGWHVAPAINQDNHLGKWGDSNTCRTAIWTNDLSLEGVYNALRARRVYATEIQDLEIVFSANGFPLGSILNEIPDEANFTAEIINPTEGNYIKEVSLVTNGGKYILTERPGTQNYNYNKTIKKPAAGWYYLHILAGTPQGDRIAVTAPIWFKPGASQL